MFDKFTVIPAIDLKGGEVVRLWRGEMESATVYGSDPAAVASAFVAAGAEIIHVVDLDGAIAGAPRNLEAVRAIRKAARCAIDLGGGLRTMDSIRAAISAGADYVSIGSAAIVNPDLLAQACREFSRRVIGSLDVRDGRVAIRGWRETSALGVDEALDRFRSAGVAAVALTDISRDGTRSGVDAEMYAGVARSAKLPVIASGGVASLEDIAALKRKSQFGVAGVIVGRALYEGSFGLAQAIKAVL